MPIIRRAATLDVKLGGVSLQHVLAADWIGAFDKPYNEGTVTLTQLPLGFDMDQSLEIIAGNGTVHTRRFIGLARSPSYDLRGNIILQGVSTLEKVYNYENSEDSGGGGLFLEDLLGAVSGTDEQVVRAVLARILNEGSDFTFGNIEGTGTTWRTHSIVDTGDAYLWASGDSPDGMPETQSAGEKALAYIYRWDMVSAVHPGPFQPAGTESGNSPGAITGPVGFYRTFQTLNGTIRRALIGGRPRGSQLFTFTEGEDIRVGKITRGYPIANRFIATGYDDGLGLGPARYVMQSSNPYMGSGRKVTAPPVSSPMIEKTAENDWVGGMSCEKVTYAQEPEFNRIIVTGEITTGRDDYISHGATALVRGPGGAPGKLGTGENVWIRSSGGRVDKSGFSQTFGILGGGVPDNFIPPVPQT